jgi:anti-sigma factor RsiW
VTCQESIEFLADYLEGKLPEAQQEEFERHMQDCPYCTEYLESYRTTIKIAGTVRDAPLAPGAEDAPEELIRAILAARKKQAE